MDDIRLVEGDTLPLLAGVVTDDAGKPVDISSGYAIALHIDYPTPLVKAATIAPGATGYYQFEWEAGDLIPGRYAAELQITSALGIQTYQLAQDEEKLMLRIERQIA